MNVFIGRDGIEIGFFPRLELESRARSGELEIGDYYWHEGMDGWLPLVGLLGEKAWQPALPEEDAPNSGLQAAPRERDELAEWDAPVSLRSRPKTTHEAARGSGLRLLAICCGGLVVAGLAVYIFARESAVPDAQADAPLFLPASSSPNPRTADEVKDKATADLRQRLERLPARAAPPLNTFYYDVTVHMKRSFSLPAPWTAVVRGKENVIDSETEQTLVHTGFTLTAEYRGEEWIYKNYRASVSDVDQAITTEVQHEAQDPAPPSLVGMLGLKIAPP